MNIQENTTISLADAKLIGFNAAQNKVASVAFFRNIAEIATAKDDPSAKKLLISGYLTAYLQGAANEEPSAEGKYSEEALERAALVWANFRQYRASFKQKRKDCPLDVGGESFIRQGVGGKFKPAQAKRAPIAKADKGAVTDFAAIRAAIAAEYSAEQVKSLISELESVYAAKVHTEEQAAAQLEAGRLAEARERIAQAAALLRAAGLSEKTIKQALAA